MAEAEGGGRKTASYIVLLDYKEFHVITMGESSFNSYLRFHMKMLEHVVPSAFKITSLTNSVTLL